MPGITFNSQVLILGTREAYNISQSAEKKVSKKKKVSKPEYSKGTPLAKDEAAKLIKFMTVRLDFELCDQLLKDSGFMRKYLTVKELEIFIGKGLISGRLEEVKSLFAKAKAMPKYAELSVSNEYFNDLVLRRKKSFKTKEAYQSMIVMTILRNGSHEALKFVLENLSAEVNLKEASVQDGDMTFSSWAETREIVELSAEERLAEAVPKTKIFDTYFEYETPLTAVLKNSESMKKVDEGSSENMLSLLLHHGADPMEKNFHVFKVAARFGLVNEIQIMIQHFMDKNEKKKMGKGVNMKPVYIALLSHAAIENQQTVIDFVKSKADPVKELTNRMNVKKVQVGANNSKPLMFQTLITEAVEKLVSFGKQGTCTFRYRLLNGIYNLLNLKLQVEDEIKKFVAENNPDALLLPPPTVEPAASSGMVINDWKPVPGSRLQANAVVNYDAAFKALHDKKTKGLGAMLNTNNNVAIGLGEASNRLSRSMSSSSVSSSGKAKKKTLIKPPLLHQWMVNILKFNDFNGENMGLVLLALGLKFYIGKPKPPRKKSRGAQSEVSSTWGMESTASGLETDVEEEDEEEKNQSDAASVASEGSRMSLGRLTRPKIPTAGRGKEGGRVLKRRKSTLSDAIDFLKKAGNKIGGQLSSKSKQMKSKDKVTLLELAADFGSQKVLNDLLELIAPQMSRTILKCVFLATIGGKFHTHKLLLNRTTKEYEAAVKEFEGSDVNRNSKKGRDRRADFVGAVDDFFVEYELSIRNRRNAANNKRNKQLNPNAGKQGFLKTARKSITDTMRRASQGALGMVFGISSGKKTGAKIDLNQFKVDLKPKKKSIRESIFGSTSASSKMHNDLKSKLKKDKGASARSNVATRLMQKKEKEFKIGGNHNAIVEDPLEEIKAKFSKFMVAMLKQSCIFGKFDLAETTIDNPYIDKTECKKELVDLITQANSPQRKKIPTNREIKGLIILLSDKMPDNLRNLPQVGRDVLAAATKDEAEKIDSLVYSLNTLTRFNKKPFFTLDDLMAVLLSIAEGSHTDWVEWPNIINLVFDNMQSESRENIQELNAKLKKAKLTKKKFPPAVWTLVSDLTNKRRRFSSVSIASGSSKRRRSSMAQKFKKATSSLRKSFSGRTGFSKSRGSSFSMRSKKK